MFWFFSALPSSISIITRSSSKFNFTSIFTRSKPSFLFYVISIHGFCNFQWRFFLSFFLFGFRNSLETLFWTPRSPTPSQVMNVHTYGQNYFYYFFYDIIHILWIFVLWLNDNLFVFFSVLLTSSPPHHLFFFTFFPFSLLYIDLSWLISEKWWAVFLSWTLLFLSSHPIQILPSLLHFSFILD